MHISLTPELEAKVRAKVESGLYNNASEVIREALRFMEQNQELLMQLKIDRLRSEVAIGPGPCSLYLKAAPARSEPVSLVPKLRLGDP